MINVRNLEFRYPEGDFRLSVPELDVSRGERFAVVGASGSGKTTLLDVIAGIRAPAKGRVQIGEDEISGLLESARRRFRVRNIGLIFQAFELLEYLNVRDNILLPYHIGPELKPTAGTRSRADELAFVTGIGTHLDDFPHQLSQGERQRAAICRALVTQPSLILADEPTGNLDPDNKQKVLDTLLAAVERHGATLVMVTHDHDLLPRFDRVLDMRELT